MSMVSLDDEEWQRVLSIISQAPWNVANPLLMKIGEQLRMQQEQTIADKKTLADQVRGNSGQSPEDSITNSIARNARQ